MNTSGGATAPASIDVPANPMTSEDPQRAIRAVPAQLTRPGHPLAAGGRGPVLGGLNT
jgi:hypothetical protein